MKKLSPSHWLILLLLPIVSFSFSIVEQGIYVQLHPDNDKKFVVQIVPDKTYSNVVAYINFYSADNKRIAQKAYSLSDEKDKYIRKGQVTHREFKFSFDKKVTRVTVDHVNEGEVLDDGSEKKGIKINLPVLNHSLASIGK
ncbi:MAG TPA: hypothetical protein VE467_03190 [Chryseolinea sp.]|jgi:hypothetical protein|nr:hypothetical protein [Chryseolinea sp.]